MLGIAFVSLGVWQSNRSDQKEQRQQYEHTQEQIRNEGDFKYMQGQLDSMNKVLVALSSSTNSSQTAAILKSLAMIVQRNDNSDIRSLSNTQVRDRVIAFAKKLRSFDADFRAAAFGPQKNTGFPFTGLRLHEEMDKFTNEFRKNYWGEAAKEYDELRRRLQNEPFTDNQGFLSLYWDGDVRSATLFADYLEGLANRLPL